MARTGVADFERDLDLAARSFADQLLGARDALTGHELQRSHAGGLLEDMESATSSVPARASIEISGVAIASAWRWRRSGPPEPCWPSGSNVTLVTRARAGCGASNSGSMRTLPVKYSTGPFAEGCEPLGRTSIVKLLVRFKAVASLDS